MQMVDHKRRGVELDHAGDLRELALHLKPPRSVVGDFHQLERIFLMLFPKSLSRPRGKPTLISGNLSDCKVAFLDPAILFSAADQRDLMTACNQALGDMNQVGSYASASIVWRKFITDEGQSQFLLFPSRQLGKQFFSQSFRITLLLHRLTKSESSFHSVLL